LIRQASPESKPFTTAPLKKSTYDSLSLREKFTYNMIHAESYQQNCSSAVQRYFEDRIFARLIREIGQGEFQWSDRQYKFFENNRDSVIVFMENSASSSKFIGINYKQAILSINAKEMTSFIINIYNSGDKDRDLLTLLMQLMKKNEYNEFIKSDIYKKLYGEDSGKSYIAFNITDEQLVIKYATDFYKSLKN
ncbi:MAG: hypothetical protein ABI480_18525, partial [Chitinophagaceae bacterium]